MKPNAIEIAKSRYRVADKALSDLKKADTYDRFFDAWFVFLTAWKGIYTVLEQGVKPSPKSMQWFGGKATERRKDPLLQYMFHARNDEEHGLKRSIQHAGGSHVYAVTPGQIISMQTDASTGGSFMVDHGSKRPLELLIQQPPGPTLVIIRDRNGKQYGPPIGHLGNLLTDISPIGVAQLALNYMEQLLLEAFRLDQA